MLFEDKHALASDVIYFSLVADIDRLWRRLSGAPGGAQPM